MVEKPPTGDTQQRRDQTRAARYQSGLPPEPGEGSEEEAVEQSQSEPREERSDSGKERT